MIRIQTPGKLVGIDPQVCAETVEDGAVLPELGPVWVDRDRSCPANAVEHQDFVRLARLGVVVERFQDVDYLSNVERTTREAEQTPPEDPAYPEQCPMAVAVARRRRRHGLLEHEFERYCAVVAIREPPPYQPARQPPNGA